MRQPDLERPVNNGVQRIYWFPNGYGASVVRHKYSYGGDRGLWEVAVITDGSGYRFRLCYDTPVTDDVLGYLSENDVDNALSKIAALPEKGHDR